MRVLISLIFSFFFFSFSGYSQSQILEGEIEWLELVNSNNHSGERVEYFNFKNAQFDFEKSELPYLSLQFEIKQQKIIQLNIIEFIYEDYDISLSDKISGIEDVGNEIELIFLNTVSKKKSIGNVFFTPIIYNKSIGKFQKVISYKIEVITQQLYLNQSVGLKSFTTNSVLSSGDWFKIAVLNEGVFKLTYEFLNDLGIDIDNVNPNNFKLYGNGGKSLPNLNSLYRPDDLIQNAVHVEGASDGVFDAGDYVLFYGQSPHLWKYSSSTNRFEHEINKYSDSTFYYITFSNTGEIVKRIATQNSQTPSNINVNSFNDYDYYEKETVNLIRSGDMWFGDVFDVKTTYDYVFNFPNIDNTSLVKLNVSVAARSSSSSSFTVSAVNSTMSLPVSFVNTTSYTARYANLQSDSTSFLSNSSVINVNVNYLKPNSTSLGWIDEIELNARRNLSMVGNQLFFRDIESVGVGNVANFSITNTTNIARLWEVTDPYNIKEQSFITAGNSLSFSLATDSLRTFVALSNDYETQIIPLGYVQNQNLHSMLQADMIIVTHSDFLSQSNQIANFHREEGLIVEIVTPSQIYNEFSSGSQDIVAIRDFIRMLYERNPVTSIPKYLLLFGDGSYDNKNRLVGNTNFIPSYQTPNSIDVIGSLASDDYYGLLDPNEGTWQGTELIDIAIGRLCVKNTTEADNVVRKILNYNTPSTMNDWRNKIFFVADDEDNNVHMNQSNQLTSIVETNNKSYNVDKVFADAYQQESTPGGPRYPKVNEAITDAVEKGSLIVNYTGHGGEAGWAVERILTVPQINGWAETNNHPLFITATCEFSRWDDPGRTSAGELILTNANGGIGLLTTIRLVFSSPNFTLNQSIFNTVFTPVNGKMPTIGEVFMKVKNLNASVSNNRNFTLLGDPALRLAYPKYNVRTTKLNGVLVSSADTISALSKVTIDGEVVDGSGSKLTSFNGVITPIVFDKSKSITTLANDGGNPFVFDLQNSKLFKGKVSVVNGDFSFAFVVPKDISYNYGQGKLSYYAENQEEDAHGSHVDFYIGGTASSYPEDKIGPEIDLYMNDNKFVFGGMTDGNPSLLAYVNDLNGINMVGNGIGHDIIAILDDETEKAFVLNDFYEADLNSYQKGVINFPFKDLDEGRHKLTLKVWDVYNNSSEATIEFVVVKSRDLVLDRVYNYPNPFTTYTEFWFEHNQPGKQLYAQVQIFTVSGKLVKTLQQNILSEGYRSTSITWDGLDDYGDQLAKGVYVYRLKVRTENYSVAEKYQKLVILR